MELRMNKYTNNYRYNFTCIFFYTSYAIKYVLTEMGNIHQNAIQYTDCSSTILARIYRTN